jgi:hypothetical protein
VALTKYKWVKNKCLMIKMGFNKIQMGEGQMGGTQMLD